MKCSKCNKEIGTIRWLDDDDKPLCDDCAPRMHRCECGRLTSNSNSICNKCSELVYSKLINNYSTKPVSKFVNYNYSKIAKGLVRKKDDSILNWMSENRENIKKTRYYGLELEYSNIFPAFTKILLYDYYKNKILYNKNDSSLDEGVEIVTSPMDYRCCKMFMKEFGSKLDEFKNNGVTTRKAGLHIHVSKDSLNTGTIIKLSLLLNSCGSSSSDNLWNVLCNRTSMNYCKVGHISTKDVLTNKDTEKYSAINLRAKDTVEFRIFSATVDSKELLKYFTMVNTLIDYCELTPVKNISSMGYLKYVMATLPKEDYLVTQIKNILDTTKGIVSNNGLISEQISFYDFMKSEKDVETAISTALSFIEKSRGLTKQQLNTYIKSYKDRSTILDMQLDTSNGLFAPGKTISNLEVETIRNARKVIAGRIFKQCV